MRKISLAGLKDPASRPRFIIWALVAVLLIAGVMIPVLGITSTRWFCSEGCHKVQDDTITAYQHSGHASISCMACHMPVSANPVIFLIHKAEALGELAQTVSNSYELPLNGESEVALEMSEAQCTQCHSPETRKFTPSTGIKIDHKVHSEKAVACTLCHNRTAHIEDFELTLKNPKSGEESTKHANFMAMTACFRCHGLEDGSPAPGACEACHPKGFKLRPASHEATGTFVAKHAELAIEIDKEVKETMHEAGIDVVDVKRKATFEEVSEKGAETHETVGELILPVEAVNLCSTCHKDAFCLACHGTPMPHSAEFIEPKDPKDPKGHPTVAKAMPDKCVMCHTKKKPNFCNECHHGEKVNYTFDPAQPWTRQHPKAVTKSGLKSCVGACHTAQFCVECHTKNKVFPGSHSQAGWTHAIAPTVTKYGSVPASATAVHSVTAQKTGTEQCEICHGAGGVNAAFCKACHKLEMPHAKDFKQFHAKTGRQSPTVCLNCHTWPQLCSNCHHVGSSTSTPWIKVHGTSVTQSGAGGCVAKCHKQADCVSCHTARKVLPGSHKAGNFIKAGGAERGVHAVLYKKDSAVCTYCHAGAAGALPNSGFCKGCHNVDMPHPAGYGLKDPSAAPSLNNAGGHAQAITSGQVARPSCTKCHEAASCNSCHHKGSIAEAPWMRHHPNVVKATGADACFECHKETYCSNCHVNLAKRGLLK